MFIIIENKESVSLNLLAFPTDIDESRLRRPVRAGNACTPVRTGFAGDAYTPANGTADGTTWRRP